MAAHQLENGEANAVKAEGGAASSLREVSSNGAASRGSRARPIRRDSRMQAGLGAAATGVWIALRYLLLPVLYIPYKLKVPTCWAYRIDAYVRRNIQPLTELPDELLRQDLPPRIGTGDRLPDIAVKRRGEPVGVRDFAKGRPLLLIAYRGSWCSYSRLHLADLAKSYDDFVRSGLEMLAVSTRRDERWWRSRGVEVPLAGDRQGVLFDALGIRSPQSLQQKVWGTLVPYESVFLFDASGKLVSCDVRDVNDYKMKQTFLSARKWLEIARQQGLRQ
jgi:peroxiredoxin